MDTIDKLLRTWALAEARGDAVTLVLALADDFRGDGPLGFVLDRTGWLDRHCSGDLVIESFAWTAVDIRLRSDTAVAVGRQVQLATYRGGDWSGTFTCTLVAVRRDGQWAIVNLQLGGWTPATESAGRPPATIESATWSMSPRDAAAKVGPIGATTAENPRRADR
jgi:hypothetical protein